MRVLVDLGEYIIIAHLVDKAAVSSKLRNKRVSLSFVSIQANVTGHKLLLRFYRECTTCWKYLVGESTYH
ncbi:uncharacterized protein PITG_21862 [Phytophthora infestans T30-4]|uniref:Uncharacterized protein n=1 Tax=Phytophthora infestans (strain T30-4) TaxID=403677 RepID=D0P4T9_PHYIT|nr:uncharacterized protein PITG_21862 [Phytophthora infestans T30-4]EEY70151.1 hypothetical protein PITG_21862 [Phytophthora infestans T30-4]|eukprot:XP_002996861.1 hypothetical protein PITG_21862 [Phytophthora infestans T30-4]